MTGDLRPATNIMLLFILLPLAAFLYASVGHGGASSYLMLLAFFDFAPEQIKPTALILNIFVSGIAFLSYRKTCVFPRELFTSLLLFSVPASFLGGMIAVDTHIYKKILGFLLLFPILRLLNVLPTNERAILERKPWMAPVLGGSIGLVSGLIGIGGGIILSPILLLLGWATVKETAAVSALFIFANSIAGLLGAGTLALQIDPQLYALMPATIAGGIAGAYFGAYRFNNQALKWLLASVLFVAASKFLLA